jgi:hypothetical protein
MQWTGAWILLLFVVFSTALMLLLLHLTKVGALIHQHIPDRPQRRLFLSAISFLLPFWRCGCWWRRSPTISGRSIG